uniref:Proline rich 33 n=1 Tax=Bubo bubo TaxID=30461 RepID=A0A8C0FEN5_BUBBB
QYISCPAMPPSRLAEPAPIHHHLSPPPTLPKPGKDNLRLQRLLKKAAKKNAVLASEQAKSFRSSLSPVNEASSDLEHNETAPPAETPETTAPPSASLPTRLSIKPITHRVPSPFRKGKPFTLKVTEQRRIAEHLPGAPETPQKPEGTDTNLPSPHNPSISVFPQPPPSSAPSKERAPEVSFVTKVHTYFHSVKPPRAKTPTSTQTQGAVSHEDKRPSSPAPESSPSEPSPGQIPTPLDDSKATAPALEPPVLSVAEAEPPNEAPRSGEHVIEPQLTPSLPNTSPPLKAEQALSSGEDDRPPGANASGWHRLKKHLMVQPEAPNFPEPEPEKVVQEEGSKEKDGSQAIISQDHRLFKSRATRLWDAILYQMTVTKERKQQAEEKKLRKEESTFLPRRLPIFLCKPRFDARKLKELAAKPMTKITTVFEVSRFRPKVAEEHTKSFNRMASGWSVN